MSSTRASAPGKPRRSSHSHSTSRPQHSSRGTGKPAHGGLNRAQRRALQFADRPEHQPVRGADEAATPSPAPQIPVDAEAVVAAGGFADLDLPAALVNALADRGLHAPFAIQTEAIPSALAGRDVLARAATGSGKTLAFGLPVLASLAGSRRSSTPRAVILAPTRELAMQVSDTLTPLGNALGLRTLLVAGGLPYNRQLQALERGVDVVVATPGRLIDLMDRGAADLSDVQISVLDEADQMCDMGFAPEVTRILQATPDRSQRMLFSATLDGDVDRLVRRFLTDPAEHATADATASVDSMEHHLFIVQPGSKARVTAELASRPGRTIIFVRTKRGADRVAEKLRAAGVSALPIHGDLNQGARTRALTAFREGHVPVLVATDVAARGIHIDNVELVIQADPPQEHKTYLHRAGRTARAGDDGTVVTLAMPRERRFAERLTSDAGLDLRGQYVEPGDAALSAITGGTQPSGVPVEQYRAPRAERSAGGRPQRGRGRPHPARRDRHEQGGPRGGSRGGGRGGRPSASGRRTHARGQRID